MRAICVLLVIVVVAACDEKKPAPKLPAVGAAVPATRGLVVAGGFDTCARRADGAFWCWGQNDRGQLGDGTTTKQTLPSRMLGSADFESVSLSGSHTCALTKAHVVRCWGRNLDGEAGSPTLLAAAPATDVLTDVVQVSAGTYVTCAVRGDKTLWCWGANDHHELGDGTTTARSVPAQVRGIADVARVAVNDGTVCALTTAGEVKCWGYDDYGTCGIGGHSMFRKRHVVPFPTTVVSSVKSKDVALAGFVACSVATDDTLRCWGEGSHGALGTGDKSKAYEPQLLAWATSFDAVAVGGFGHSCARRVDGSVWCWGYDIAGGSDRLAPERVAGLVVTELALGHTHACGRRTDGVVLCWGNNDDRQLGDGTNTSTSRPIVIVSP